MTKFIHCADIHLLSPFAVRDEETAAVLDRENFAAFEKMLQTGVQRGAAFVIIAGDLFDAKSVDTAYAAHLSELFQKYAALRFYIAGGNKDEYYDGCFAGSYPWPDNVRFFTNRWEKIEEDGVNIFGYSLERGDMIAPVRQLPAPAEGFNIVVMHGLAPGHVSPIEYNVLDMEALAQKNIGYLALGHVHAPAQRAFGQRGGIYAYSGSLSPRSFDDTGPHGYMLVTVAGNAAKAEFVNSGAREAHTVKVDISGKNDIYAQGYAIASALEAVSGRDIVKIILTGETTLESAHVADRHCERFGKQFFHVEIENAVCVSDRYLRGLDPASLPAGFAAAVASSARIPEAARGAALKAGLTALGQKEARK